MIGLNDVFTMLRVRYFNSDKLARLFASVALTLLIYILLVTLFNLPKYTDCAFLSFLSNLLDLKALSLPNELKILLYICIFLVSCFLVGKFPDIPLTLPCNLEISANDISLRKLKKLFEFQGLLSDSYLNQKCIFLTSSHDGMLTKRYFRDCSIKFDAKLFLGGFGLLLKAKNLEQYFMLKFNVNNQGDAVQLTINPNLRNGSYWEVLDHRSVSLVDLNLDVTIAVDVHNEFVKCTIWQKGEQLISEEYLLPDYFPHTPAIIERGRGHAADDAAKGANEFVGLGFVNRFEYPKYSKVGFRAYSHEKALIRSLKIERT